MSIRIGFFGDSFTLGTGDEEYLGWVGRVCQAWRMQGHELTAYNLGVRRDTSGDILARWAGEANARLPQEFEARLVFSFGCNDSASGEVAALSRLNLSQTLANAQSILVSAQKRGPTFLIGPLPVFSDSAHNARIRAMSDALGDLCATLEVPYLALTALPDAFWDAWRIAAKAGDGVHPNSTGYERLAKVISVWPPLASSLERLC